MVMEKLWNLCQALGGGYGWVGMYLLVMNAAAFALFALDKLKAVLGKWRIRERMLLGMCLAGGAAGGLLAMLLCRHKIRKTCFRWGVPAMLGLQLALMIWLRIR